MRFLKGISLKNFRYIFQPSSWPDGLRITGIKEPIECVEADDGSRGWMVGIRLTGLVPVLKPGGNVDTYVIELISSDGEVPTSGRLSQAPRAGSKSIIVAIGKLGAPSGEYVVRVRGNGEEARLKITAPDCLSPRNCHQRTSSPYNECNPMSLKKPR
jgi:hypothetical protein